MIRPMEAASSAPTDLEAAAYSLDRQRYRRIITFFSLNFLRFLWWEVVLRRFVGERFVGRGREERYRQMARRFRALAVQMGGVMIKLGQFISTRVDILPDSIIQELAGLQDEVPPAPFEQIQQIIHEQLGHLEGHLALNPYPLAAASFGQVYKARLDGDTVIVKVQRPNIRASVQTDLQALRVVAKRAMRWSFIALRADVPRLLEEFGRVLWEELDYLAEASHAERFAQMFADDMGVYVPQIYRHYSGRRLLVMEDVSAIKINDYTALEAAGIDRLAVARRLLDTYLTQVFKERFFHADPHPGNIFIYPLPQGVEHSGIDHGKGQPFYLIFVDYGMVGRLTPQLVEILRQTLISLGLRDARGMVESYARLGILMPDADKERIIEATRRAFDLVWGLDMSEMGNLSYGEMATFGSEFSDLLFSMPFRLPHDLLYLGRCAGILSGMCTGLDPKFDPWREMQPYVATLLEGGNLDKRKEEPLWAEWGRWVTPQTLQALLTVDNLEIALKASRDYGLRALQLPILADELLRKADRGELQTRIKLDPDLQQRLNRLEQSNQRLVVGMVFAALSITGAILWVSNAPTLGGLSLGLAALTWLRLVWGDWR
jgi:predicted unusual protein kinase regulating ubiquinone biosynthesis (AarF/ABC1/UbiB family)